MTIHIKDSTVAGAPIMCATAGALIGVLDWFLVTELGWTKEFSNSTTGAAYRPPTGNRFYYQFDHALTYQTEMRSFVSMTDWNAGSGGTPTSTVYCPNRNTTIADSTPLAYTLISDGTFVILLLYQGNTTGGYAFITFGDIISYLPEDNFASVLAGTSGNTSPSSGHTNDTSAQAHRKLVRAADQLEAQKSFGYSTASTLLQSHLGSGDVLYPNEVTGGLVLFPILVVETSPNVIRGRLPGILSPTRVSTLLAGTTFNGTGDLAGRTYKVFSLGGSSTLGKIAIETSDTWRT